MTPPPKSSAPRRKRRPQFTLEVLERQWLTPNMVRLRLGGAEFSKFEYNSCTDAYVKLQFAEPDDTPVTRTYTVREYNAEDGWLTIDFVVHGDEGLAAVWASRVAVGETIRLAGPGGAYRPDPEADWHLLIGDESSMPAIAAALEVLPPDAVGQVILEVGSAVDELELEHPSGIGLRWIHRDEVDQNPTGLLAEAVRGIEWSPGRVQVFCHGERESMKLLRGVLFKEHGLERSQVSLSGYWARGRTEDRFQAEKKEPIGRILPPLG